MFIDTAEVLLCFCNIIPGEAAIPTDPDADQDRQDAMMLGLDHDVPDKPGKRRGMSGPRVKRSREEVFEEETEKLAAKFNEMVETMSDPSAAMPTVAACAKHLRAISPKADEARAAGMFQCVSSLETLQEKCALIKEAIRVSNVYVNPNGTTKKAHEEAFIAAFQKLPLEMLHKFPRVMLDRFYHVVHSKDMTFKWLLAIYLFLFII